MNQESIQIIATIGYASAEPETMRSMMKAGMSVMRLNFSWGTYEEHQGYIETMRHIAEEAGKRIPIIQDLSGPRVITGSGHTYDATAPVVTKKDRQDVLFGAKYGVEYVALSYVSSGSDIEELAEYLTSIDSKAKIIAKIERQEAVENLDAIIAAADGVMVARGDLGNEIPYETLPFVKQDILSKAREAGKPSIVATEMLTSMMEDTEPSRSDISDIADAVADGASATMLSDETAVGEHPIEAISVMRRVVDEAIKHVKEPNTARF